jgi:hypothetical protein
MADPDPPTYAFPDESSPMSSMTSVIEFVADEILATH